MAAVLLTSATAFAGGPDKLKSGVVVDRSEVFRSYENIMEDPVFERRGDRVLLNMLNLDEKAVVIRLLDANGKLVFEEKSTGETIVSKSFNFTDAFKGEYTIVILDDQKRFKEVVVIE